MQTSRLFDQVASGSEEQVSGGRPEGSEGSPVSEYLRTQNYEPLDGSPMNLQCVVDVLFIPGSVPPEVTQSRSCIIEFFERGLEVWRLRQDPETSFGKPVCLQIPFANCVARHLFTLLPHSIPEVLGESDDEGKLL
jgi:hypothetical protein